MESKFDRRTFLRVAGTSLSIGALYSVFAPLAHGAGKEVLTRSLAELNGEAPAPFSFIQLSDTHVGFNGPPDPLGTRAFESAVATINALKRRPELVIITGDLTHDADSPDEHAKRYKLFKQIAGEIRAAQVKVVPGETTRRLTAAICSANSWGRRITPSTIAVSTSSRSTTSRPGGPQSARSSLPG
jgi:hypothetical protein